MAYKGELMTRDDAMAACMERARDLGALTMVHAENGDVVDLLVKRALHAGQTDAIHHALTRPEFVEAEATARAARLAEYTGASLFVVHVTCAAAAAEIEAAQQRGVPVSGETCTQYLVNTIDDLRRPGVEGCRYICSPPLRDGVQPRAAVGLRAARDPRVASPPTTARSPTSRRRAASTTSASCPTAWRSIQHRLAKLWDEGVVAGRITPSQLVDRTSTTIARRFGLPGQGRDRAGQGRRHRRLRPVAPRDYGTHTSFMNVDYDLYEGETASGSVRHTLSRGTMVYDRGEIVHRARPRALRRARRRGGRGDRMTLVVDADRVLADLHELAAASGGEHAGAKRLAWSPDWTVAREWLLGKLDEIDGVSVDRDEAGNLWAELPGDGSTEGFVIVGSHIDAVPSGGWLDGALGVMAALEVLRTLAAAAAPSPVAVRLVDWADEEGARFGRSLVGSSAVAGTLDPDDVRDLRDAGGMRLQDAMAAVGVDLDGASARDRAPGRRAGLPRAAHRAGPGPARHAVAARAPSAARSVTSAT